MRTLILEHRTILSSLLLLLSACALCLSGCDRAAGRSASGPGLRGKLILTGSSTCAPLVSEIAKRLELENPGLRIDVQTGGSSRGITDAGSGLADVGMSSRHLKASEEAGRRSHLLAKDGVGFVVHGSNPVDAITTAQVRAIYSGQIRNWKELGGDDAAITVVNRADGRSELELVTEHLGLESKEMFADVICGENQHGLKTVLGDPHALIYISIGSSEYEIARDRPLKLLALDGIEASSRSVRVGEYPLSRPLLLITRQDPTHLVQAFVDWALSPDVHDLVEAHSFVPLQ